MRRPKKADTLRSKRIESGFSSQQAIATAAGLSIATVALAERGLISRRTAERLAPFLRCAPEELIARERS